MKRTSKKLLALFLAAVMCITSLPMNALAVYYAPGTVIDEDEETETPSVIFDEDSGTVYYSPGTVISDDDPLPTGQHRGAAPALRTTSSKRMPSKSSKTKTARKWAYLPFLKTAEL